jgi:hypothetical protein
MDAYSIFIYGIRSPLTRDYYLRRLKIFFNYIELLPEKSISERCNCFAEKGKENSQGTFNNIIKFLQFQKERVQQGEITSGTLKNFLKAIKLFCEMADIQITWKKITRGLPKVRRYADDRAPTLEEIQKISEYPDRRIKSIIFTMTSSGIRIGAWDYLKWGHIKPIEKNGEIVAAKIIVYAGDQEQYFTFMNPEAYNELKKWMDYRKDAGEEINEKSWVMRHIWNTKNGRIFGLITAPKRLKSNGVKSLIQDALWSQDIRKKSQLNGNRYEFQTDHGFRKWFKTRCELAGMKSINIEILMGHSIGISDSYYRITENELLEDYLKVSDLLMIDKQEKLQKELHHYQHKNQEETYIIKGKLQEREEEIKSLKQKYESDMNSFEERMESKFQQMLQLINVGKIMERE